ncbi:MAG: DUF3789 domain-containing protein [Eubacteriales bacterium]|nr:DUF3789 domain-containing protein [Eubacteriales bacterium]
MIGILAAFFVGALFGVFLMCCLQISRDEKDRF